MKAHSENYWWLGALVRIRLASDQSNGRVAVLEVTVPEGYEAPPHIHRFEDETFVVLEGELTFTVGDDTTPGGPGAAVFGPRDVPHQFRVEKGPARLLYVLTPGGFEGFVRETGEVATALTLPPADVTPDFGLTLSVASRYGNEVLVS